MPTFVNETTVFNSPVSFNILPRRNIDKFPLGATAISVANIEHFTTHNTGAITVTEFTKGTRGQEITLLGDDETTIQENASIVTNVGDILLAAGHIYKFVNFDEVWYYVCCNGGGGSGSPGGSNSQVQYNDGGSFGGAVGLLWDDTNHIFSVADSAGSPYVQFHPEGQVIQFGLASSSIYTWLKTADQGTTLHVEADSSRNGGNHDANIYLTSEETPGVIGGMSHRITATGDQGFRIDYNFIGWPTGPGGVHNFSDPDRPQLQVSIEVAGAFAIAYSKAYNQAPGTYDTSGGKTFLFYPHGLNYVNSQRLENATLAIGNPKRGFSIAVDDSTTDTPAGSWTERFLIKSKAADATNPIYMWVNGALRQVLSFNDGSGHNVLYY